MTYHGEGAGWDTATVTPGWTSSCFVKQEKHLRHALTGAVAISDVLDGRKASVEQIPYTPGDILYFTDSDTLRPALRFNVSLSSVLAQFEGYGIIFRVFICASDEDDRIDFDPHGTWKLVVDVSKFMNLVAQRITYFTVTPFRAQAAATFIGFITDAAKLPTIDIRFAYRIDKAGPTENLYSMVSCFCEWTLTGAAAAVSAVVP